MFLLVVLWLIVIAVWLVLAVRHWNLGNLPISFATTGALIVIFGSVFGYDFFHIPAPIPITSDRALLGMTSFVFACLVIRRRQFLSSINWMDISVYGLLAVLICSAALTQFSYNNNLPISRFIFFYLLPAILYFVVRNSKIQTIDMQIVGGMLVGLCIYLALTAFAESRGMYALVYPSYIRDAGYVEFFGRGRGPFLNPISNGIFLTTGFALALMLFFCCKGKIRWIVAASIPLLAIGNIATLTRSVWLGMMAVGGLILFLKTDRKQKAVLIISGTVASVVVLGAVGENLIRFKRDKYVSENEMSQSAQLRPIFAAIAWEMFKDRPLVGCGFGQYNFYKPDYLSQPNATLPLDKAKPYLQHNVFLSLLTETGILGTSFLLMLLFNACRFAVRVYRHTEATPWQQAIAMTLIAFLTSYVINGMFHDVSIIPMAHMLMLFLIGINVANFQQLFAPESERNTRAIHSRTIWDDSGQNASGVIA